MATASSSCLCWWKDTTTASETTYLPARYYPNSSAAVASTSHIPVLHRQALTMKLDEVLNNVPEPTPIVLVFATPKEVFLQRADAETVNSRIDRNFEQRWDSVMVALERQKERTGSIPREAAAAIRTAMMFDTLKVKETALERTTNTVGTASQQTAVRVQTAVAQATALAPRPSTPVPNNTSTTATAIHPSENPTVTSAPSTPVRNNESQQISIRDSEDDGSAKEEEDTTTGDTTMEEHNDEMVAESESVASPEPMNTEESDEDEDSDDEEEELPEVADDTPIEQVWELHEQVGWYKKRINANESHFVAPRGVVYTSLEDFCTRHVQPNFPGWTGPQAIVVTPKARPQARGGGRKPVVTATHKKQPPLRAQRPNRRRATTVPLHLAAPTPFRWNHMPELQPDDEIAKILKALGCKIVNNKQTNKRTQYILPGTSKNHGFRSLRGVQQYLYDHGLPRSSQDLKPLKRKTTSDLALWISCAPIQDEAQLLDELRESEPLKKEESLRMLLQSTHRFFKEGERLYVPNFRDVPQSDGGWEYGKHYFHSTYDLHTLIRDFVRDSEDDTLRNDPQLRRWCYADSDVPPEPSSEALADATLEEYTVIEDDDFDNTAQTSKIGDVNLDFVGEETPKTTSIKSTSKKSKKFTTPSKPRHWWESESFPSFDQEIQPLLLKMGCTQQTDDKWILPWWPRQAFSTEAVAAMCRVHVDACDTSTLDLTEREILRRWVMFSILGSKTGLLRDISSPVKHTAGLADLFQTAGWKQEPERLFVPGYQDIDRPGVEYIYGVHFFRRDCDAIYMPSEERSIRAYLRHHPEAAGDSAELLKWAANDSTADLPIREEPTIDQMMQLLDISVREGTTNPNRMVTSPTFSFQDIACPNEQEPAWYLTTERPTWQADVRPFAQAIGILKSKGSFVLADVPETAWRTHDDLAKFFLQHGIPDLSPLNEEDAKTFERWVRFHFVPDQSTYQMKLADRFLRVTTLENLVEKAGVSALFERLLSDPDLQATEQLRLRLCTTESLRCPDETKESSRSGRRGHRTSGMTTANKSFYLLALRLWAANGTATLPSLAKGAQEKPAATVVLNGESTSIEPDNEPQLENDGCNEGESSPAAGDSGVSCSFLSKLANDWKSDGVEEATSVTQRTEQSSAEHPIEQLFEDGESYCGRALLSDQSNTPPTTKNLSVVHDGDDVVMQEQSKRQSGKVAASLKRQFEEKSVGSGQKKHKSTEASVDSSDNVSVYSCADMEEDFYVCNPGALLTQVEEETAALDMDTGSLLRELSTQATKDTRSDGQQKSAFELLRTPSDA